MLPLLQRLSHFANTYKIFNSNKKEEQLLLFSINHTKYLQFVAVLFMQA